MGGRSGPFEKNSVHFERQQRVQVPGSIETSSVERQGNHAELEHLRTSFPIASAEEASLSADEN
jgi:hypothetical protein